MAGYRGVHACAPDAANKLGEGMKRRPAYGGGRRVGQLRTRRYAITTGDSMDSRTALQTSETRRRCSVECIMGGIGYTCMSPDAGGAVLIHIPNPSATRPALGEQEVCVQV
jgi:hypothetical protein